MNVPQHWPFLFFAPQGMLLAYFLWRSAFPAVFVTDDNTSITYQKKRGEIAIIKVDQTATGTLTIPKRIGRHHVTSINARAFFQCDQFKEVILPDSIRRIGDSAFGRCTNLAQLVFKGNAPQTSPRFQLPNPVQVGISKNALGFDKTFGGTPVIIAD